MWHFCAVNLITLHPKGFIGDFEVQQLYDWLDGEPLHSFIKLVKCNIFPTIFYLSSSLRLPYKDYYAFDIFHSLPSNHSFLNHVLFTYFRDHLLITVTDDNYKTKFRDVKDFTFYICTALFFFESQFSATVNVLTDPLSHINAMLCGAWENYFLSKLAREPIGDNIVCSLWKPRKPLLGWLSTEGFIYLIVKVMFCFPYAVCYMVATN